MNQIEIGKFIRESRMQKGLTQEELAKKLYVSNKTVSKWELGKCMPSIDMLLPLCKELGMELNELLEGKHTANQKESYENILLQTLKKTNQTKIRLIFGILVCIFLCILEVLLYIGHVDTKISSFIFLCVILFLILVDVYEYFMFKRK